LDKREKCKFSYLVKNYIKSYDEEVLEKIMEQSKLKIELISNELEMRKNGKSNSKCDGDSSSEHD